MPVARTPLDISNVKLDRETGKIYVEEFSNIGLAADATEQRWTGLYIRHPDRRSSKLSEGQALALKREIAKLVTATSAFEQAPSGRAIFRNGTYQAIKDALRVGGFQLTKCDYSGFENCEHPWF